MPDLATRIAKALVDTKDPLAGMAIREIASVIRPVIAASEAERAKRDEEARLLLGAVAYMLDGRPKWEDDRYPAMTKEEARQAVLKVLRLMGGDDE